MKVDGFDIARIRARIGRLTAADVTAGMATGLFSIPEGMAYASIAGFNPVAGLYAGVMPPILGSLTASTVLMVTTLTSAIALTGQSVLSDAGLNPQDMGNVAALAILVGLVMVLMGVLRLGVVLSFVSNAVMIGFSTGIALSIITGVFEDATDYKPHGHNKLVQAWNWITGISHWQSTTTLVAVATIAVWALARVIPKIESLALLVAMVVVSVGVAAFGVDVELVRGIAEIPGALPGLSLPNLDAMPQLLPGAFSVALVALAQAAGVAPSMPNPDGSRSNMNGDFISQGVANIGGGLFQALPAGGSLSRTGVAASVGARTRWAGIVSGVFLAVVVLTCAGLAERIPVPVIGGLILVVGGELIWGKRADIAMVWRTSKLSTAAMIATFAATTQLPLQRAIVIGAMLSLLLYCVQATLGTELTALHKDSKGVWSFAEVPAKLPSGEVTVLNYDGSSFFAELPRLEAGLPDLAGARNAVLVLALRSAPDIPSSAMLKLFRRYANELRAEGGQLILAGVRPALAQALRRTGMSDVLGADEVIPASTVLLGPLDEAIARGHAWIESREGDAGPGRKT
ncbi:STAS domain-containing protein [Nocardia sp. SYP-A9097]|uniref:SulP family inorganic anion transporter n=1 Tax=Nocardia sp. SYP-A9097 TaxID=2663237 RepID=UPI00129BFC97|nr:SulP family inorganic anion transporter [Nocardia sp. SYP-A9097]MRH91837.1 STAS domain-containing protein [Nocardia sp. SYP-A9097]